MFTVPYEPGDRLILYTDGISEATNRQGKLLDIPRLQALIQEHGHLPVNDHVDAIIEGVDTFRDGAVPDDDQLLLAVSYSGGQ